MGGAESKGEEIARSSADEWRNGGEGSWWAQRLAEVTGWTNLVAVKSAVGPAEEARGGRRGARGRASRLALEGAEQRHSWRRRAAGVGWAKYFRRREARKRTHWSRARLDHRSAARPRPAVGRASQTTEPLKRKKRRESCMRDSSADACKTSTAGSKYSLFIINESTIRTRRQSHQRTFLATS